jgi:hypothetical protein
VTSNRLKEFAKRYAKAWCSQNPDSVAAFFAERGSISINNGPPAVGRAAIAKEAEAFMTMFPDMIVTFDKLEPRGDRTAFHWTLTGTNSGLAALEIVSKSAATNSGKSTMEPAGAGLHGRESPRGLTSREASQSTMDSSENQKATLTARNTNVSSSTDLT